MSYDLVPFHARHSLRPITGNPPRARDRPVDFGEKLLTQPTRHTLDAVDGSLHRHRNVLKCGRYCAVATFALGYSYRFRARFRDVRKRPGAPGFAGFQRPMRSMSACQRSTKGMNQG